MGLDKIAENKIRQAMAEGAFDNLPNLGPIDLEEYFKLPPELRMAHSVLKSAGCVPEEVELLRTIAQLESAVGAAANESARAHCVQQLEAARLRLALLLERSRRK